jgi:alginate O-acetyltransferase complex protein AlgI
MIFTTYWFLALVGITLPVYWLARPPTVRLLILGVSCALFHYHFAGPAGVAPIVVLMGITYFAALTRSRAACAAAMVACVLALGFYKYTGFLLSGLVSHINPGLAEQLGGTTSELLPELPPLGISFFVFEFVHYLFEVRRGGEPIRNPLQFILFSIFFPSLVAGPIKRYGQFLPALAEGSRNVGMDNVAAGLRRVGIGFFKKVVVADNLTYFIDLAQPGFASLSIFERWLLLTAISLRILMDFSGYSDIAIGFARMLGVKLPENFNWPYLARNIQDFWQRWHISLSTWIRDYVYIPLGGNRHGVPRRILNGMTAFALCGLWHGAAWNFVLWGLYHGIGLAACSTYERIPGLGPRLAAIWRKEPLASWAITQLFVWIGWLLFFYPVPEAWQMTKMLFGA